jgi:hypothetical protein
MSLNEEKDRNVKSEDRYREIRTLFFTRVLTFINYKRRKLYREVTLLLVLMRCLVRVSTRASKAVIEIRGFSQLFQEDG